MSGRNCGRCLCWTEEPSGDGLCRGGYDYANARFPLTASTAPLKAWQAELLGVREDTSRRMSASLYGSCEHGELKRQCERCEMLAEIAELKQDREKVARIAAIVNALHNGDDGELTPGQARHEAIKAICAVLGEPF